MTRAAHWWTLATALLLLLGAPARAQSVLPAQRSGATVYVAADALARALGGHLRDGGQVLTLHTATGALLTVFAGDAEAVMAGEGVTAGELVLSAPARHGPDGWWLPLDAADLLGLAPDGAAGEALATRWRAPDGSVWRLHLPEPPTAPLPPQAERVELAGEVTALRLYAPGGSGTPEGLSLMLVDLELLALARPALRDRLDAALAPLRGRRALAAVATSLEPSALDLGAIALRQDGRSATPPLRRWQTLAGDPARVTEDQPWLGALWLPEGYRLDLPLTVAWHGVAAEVRFRR